MPPEVGPGGLGPGEGAGFGPPEQVHTLSFALESQLSEVNLILLTAAIYTVNFDSGPMKYYLLCESGEFPRTIIMLALHSFW